MYMVLHCRVTLPQGELVEAVQGPRKLLRKRKQSADNRRENSRMKTRDAASCDSARRNNRDVDITVACDDCQGQLKESC